MYHSLVNICLIAGIFTVPMTGTWRISFSLMSLLNTGDYNYAYLYHNGQLIPETLHKTHSNSGEVWSTGGREILVTAQQGDTLTLRTERLDYHFNYILTCFEYNADAVAV